MAAIPDTGRLEEISLPRLLGDLYRAQFNGRVELGRQRVEHTFLLASGAAIGCESAANKNGLCDQLVTAGTITQKDRDRAISLIKSKGCKEANALLQLGLLDPRGLVLALRDQVRFRLLECISWPKGAFTLDAGAPPSEAANPFRIDVYAVLQAGIEAHWRADQVLLDLEPTTGLRDALESPGRIDSLFVESATARLTENLSVMATEETLSSEVHFKPEAIDLLFDTLGRTNEYIIVDLPRSALAVRQRIFETVTDILLITELTLPGLRDAMRIISSIEETVSGKSVIVIANRTGSPHQAMSPKDFQKALGHKIEFLIPQDDKAFKQAANNGKPLIQIDSRGKPAKAMQSIVDKLTGEKKSAKNKDAGTRDGKSGKKSSWSWIFKKG